MVFELKVHRKPVCLWVSPKCPIVRFREERQGRKGKKGMEKWERMKQTGERRNMVATLRS